MMVLVVILLALPAVSPRTALPNVIFTLVDDWGSADAAYRERSLRGVAQLITPTIDKLAASGIKLERYYTQHICSPTRSALLSGRYQIHTGLQDGIIQAWARVCLPTGFGTIGDAFTTLGYRTAMVGKWHVGIYRDACLPWNRGFATYFGFLTGSELHYTKLNRIGRTRPENSSETQLYPDLRTQDGPVRSHCITPPLDPPPPPPPSCGLPGQPRCQYTQREGYLAAGHDAVPVANRTLAEAEAVCNALPNCSAVTFAATDATECEAPPHCKMYLKTAAAGTNPAGANWLTFFKYPPPPSAQGDPGCYSTHLFTAEAIRVIEMHAAANRNTSSTFAKAQALFLYLALQEVHEPLEVPAPYVAPYMHSIDDSGRRTYAGMVSVVDECLANLTGALRGAGMWANTVLVVSNDNGGWMGYGGLNTPHRGHKTTLWEGGVRGLGFIVAPGRLTAGAKYGGLFHVTDWLPTLVGAAGAAAGRLGEPFAALDGVSHWDALRSVAALDGDPSPDGRAGSSLQAPRTELLHNIEGLDGTGVAAIRVGKYKLLHRMQTARGFDGWCDVCNHTEGCWMPPDSGPGAGAPDGKVVPHGGQLCCFAAPPADANFTASCAPALANHSDPLPDDLLYDIDADPWERYDLARSLPEVVRQLHARLDVYNASNVPCCICTGSDRTEEMNRPPIDGYWYAFHDQTPNPDPNCKMQHRMAWQSRGDRIFEGEVS